MKKRMVAIILTLVMMMNGNIVMAAQTQNGADENSLIAADEEQEESEQISEKDEETSEDTDVEEDAEKNLDDSDVNANEDELETEDETDKESESLETGDESGISQEEIPEVNSNSGLIVDDNLGATAKTSTRKVSETYTGYYIGKISNADWLTGLVIDNFTYKVSDDFVDFQKATNLWVEHGDENVLFEFKEGVVTRLDLLSDVVNPRIQISTKTDTILYQNGKYDQESLKIEIRIKNDIKNGSTYDEKLINEAKGNSAQIRSLKLKLSDSILSFDENQKESIISENFNWGVNVGSYSNIKTNIYVDTNVKPQKINTRVKIEGSYTLKGTKKQINCNSVDINIGNVDLQQKKSVNKKENSNIQKQVKEAEKLFDKNTIIGLDSTIDYYVTAEQKKEINKYLTIWLSTAIESQKFTPQNLTYKMQEEVRKKVLKKLGVSMNTFLVFKQMSAVTEVIVETKSHGERTFRFTVDVGNYALDEEDSAYAGFGKVNYSLLDSTDIKGVPTSGTGTVTFANMEKFAEQVGNIADRAVKSFFGKALAKDVDKIAALYVSEPMSKFLKGKFVDKSYKLITSPTKNYCKKVSVKCPVNVYVYDSDMNLCGAVVDNVVDDSYDDLLISVVNDEKYIYLPQDDYSIKLVGTETGTMEYTIQEYENGELIRSANTTKIPLNTNVIYYGILPEIKYADNDIITLSTENGDSIDTTKDDHLIREETEKEVHLVWQEKCGENATFKFYSDGRMVVSGTGPMDDYIVRNFGSSHTDAYANTPWRGTEVKYLIVEEGITRIGKAAFLNKSSLRVVELADSVESIGESAFNGCSNLQCLSLGEKFSNLEEYALSYCSALNVYVSEKNPNYVVKNNSIFTADLSKLVKYLDFYKSEYNIPDETLTIGVDAFGDCTIEKITGGNNIKTIEAYAFEGCESLKEVELSNKLESIGEFAFQSCSGLTKIIFPDKLKSIGRGAFSSCKGLTEIELPNELESIGFGAFESCEGLKKIVFPDTLSTIAECAFKNCCGLTEIKLPNELERIKGGAFEDCSGLKKVVIHSKVKDIRGAPFSGCSNVCLYVEENSYAQQYAKEHNIPYRLIGSESDTPQELAKVAIKAQTWGYNQTKVSWNKVSGAQGYRVYYATSKNGAYKYLAQINSGSTTSYYHKKLTTGKTYYYKVRAFQKENGHYIFGEYSDVKSAKPVPKTVKVTKAESFGCNTKLSWDKVSGANGYRLYYYTPESSKYQYITQITSGKTTSYLHTGLKAGQTYCYKIRAYRTVNGEKVFGAYSAVKEVTPSKTGIKLTGVQSWGYNQIKVSWNKVSKAQGYRIYYSTSAKSGYQYLAQMKGNSTTSYIHKKLTTGKTYYYKVRAYQKVDGKYIFGEYSNVKSAKPVPKAVKIKSATAGENSVKLSWDKVSGANGYRIYYRIAGAQAWEYVAQVGSSTFAYTHKGLENGHTYEYRMRAYQTVGGTKVFGAYSAVESVSLGNSNGDFRIQNGILNAYSGTSETVVIPSGVTAIGSGVFFANENIKSVVIPEGVTKIGQNAFLDCTNLSSVEFPKSVDTILTDAFTGTKWLDIQREWNPLVIVNDILLDGKTASGDVEIPYGIKTIGYYAFCPESHYGQESKITSIAMPDSVEKIEMWAFGECSKLERVSGSENLKSIGQNAFRGCISLEDIDLGNANSIGISAFRDCSSLTYIVIPLGVTRVEESTFANCTSLTGVMISSTVTYIEDGNLNSKNGAFANCPLEIILGDEGSYAQSYAKAHDIIFKIIY